MTLRSSRLFSEVVPPEKVLPRAMELAEDVATNTSAVSTHLMKELMWRGRGSAEETHLLDSKILLEIFASKDKQEGVNSFLQKRRPDFQGNMSENPPRAWPWWEPIDTRAPTTVEDVMKRLLAKPKL